MNGRGFRVGAVDLGRRLSSWEGFEIRLSRRTTSPAAIEIPLAAEDYMKLDAIRLGFFKVRRP